MTSFTPGAADYRWRQGPRSRRRLLMAVSLLTAGCLLVGDGLAQEPPRRLPPPPGFTIPTNGFALWNECEPIGLLIESLNDDAAAIDLTEERIQTLAESRLRAARLYASEVGTRYMYIRVTVLIFKNRPGGAYSSRVSFQKYLRDGVSQQIGIAATWDASGIGIHTGDAGYILQHVSEQLDRFILEYLRVNEAACG